MSSLFSLNKDGGFPDDIRKMLVDVVKFLDSRSEMPDDIGVLVWTIAYKLPVRILFVLQLDPEDVNVATMAGVVSKLAMRRAILGGSDSECHEGDLAMQNIASDANMNVVRLASLVDARLLAWDEDGEVPYNLAELIGDFIEEPSRATCRRVEVEFKKMLELETA